MHLHETNDIGVVQRSVVQNFPFHILRDLHTSETVGQHEDVRDGPQEFLLLHCIKEMLLQNLCTH